VDFVTRWSPEAVEDLELIAEYIARDSAYYARSIVTEILSLSRHIAEFPHIGRQVPEMDDDNIRERLIHNYRLIYQVEPNKVLIVAVIHGKRLLEIIDSRFE